MKNKSFFKSVLLNTLLFASIYFPLKYIVNRTIGVTEVLMKDEQYTEWVKAAKAVEKIESDTIASDTIKVWGDAVR